jgi:hypothetical protein
MSAPSPTFVAPLVALALAVFALEGAGHGEPAVPRLPEGNVGVTARYPGDIGIEKDRAVVLHADFEDCRSAADLTRTWDAAVHDGNMRITEEPANVHSGRRALEIIMPRQREELAVGLDRILGEGQEVLFLRFYAKLEEGFDVPRTSLHNGGSISAGYWRGESAGPGKRADGRNKFLVNYEPDFGPEGSPSPRVLNIYIYHPEQRDIWGDHFFPSGTVSPNTSLRGDFGPHFVPRPDIAPELDRWRCFEFMVKANTPGKRDGRVACWLDGTVIADFPHLRLRDVDTLKIDRFGVGLYIANNSRRENRKWYDDIVAATSYIGPQVGRRGGSD